MYAMSLLEASLGHYRDILNNGSSDPGVLLVSNKRLQVYILRHITLQYILYIEYLLYALNKEFFRIKSAACPVLETREYT